HADARVRAEPARVVGAGTGPAREAQPLHQPVCNFALEPVRPCDSQRIVWGKTLLPASPPHTECATSGLVAISRWIFAIRALMNRTLDTLAASPRPPIVCICKSPEPSPMIQLRKRSACCLVNTMLSVS